MSQVATTHGAHDLKYEEPYESRYETHVKKEAQVTGWTGWIGFGGFMMILAGMFQAIAGLVAIFRDSFFAVSNGSDKLLIINNINDWGWVNLIAGSVIILAGLALFTGATWARIIAVLMAMSCAVINLVSITLYPVWSMMAIALSVLVIYAVIAHGSELKEE